jgi:glycolate oxidase iron-sulfur subunit
LHLDRCLTCRSCQTTCPSGVKYAELLDIGRDFIEQQVSRPWWQKAAREIVRKTLITPLVFNFLTNCAPFVKQPKVKLKKSIKSMPAPQKTVLLLSGCVQPQLAPHINLATQSVLEKCAIKVIITPQKQCCGAVSQHLSAPQQALIQIKQNIDAWLIEIEKGAEAIIFNASGCGVMLKDYPKLLAEDLEYKEKAQKIANLSIDLSEFLNQQDLTAFKQEKNQKIAFHVPCTLQHGLKKQDVVEKILTDLGYQLNPIKDAHLCCGSAGTYSIFQAKISNQLRVNKLSNLEQIEPDLIVSANIGCIIHLQKGTKISS